MLASSRFITALGSQTACALAPNPAQPRHRPIDGIIVIIISIIVHSLHMLHHDAAGQLGCPAAACFCCCLHGLILTCIALYCTQPMCHAKPRFMDKTDKMTPETQVARNDAVVGHILDQPSPHRPEPEPRPGPSAASPLPESLHVNLACQSN